MTNKSIFEKEAELVRIQTEDPSNPRLFTLLLDFCEHYMRWKKWQLPEHTLEDYYTAFAEGIFMRIQKKGPLDSSRSKHPFINYMNVCRGPVFYHYYNDQEYLYVNTNTPEEDLLLSAFCNIEDMRVTLRDAEVESAIQALPNMVVEVLNSSKYYSDTPQYLNARTSLLLSLLKREYIPYNQDQGEEMYGRMLYRHLYDKFTADVKDSICHYIVKQFSDMDIYKLSMYELQDNNDADRK